MSFRKQERHKCAWEVIENHESELYRDCVKQDFDAIIAGMIGTGVRLKLKVGFTIMKPFSKAIVLAAVSASYWIAKRNVTLVTIIFMTASLPSKTRKETVTRLVQFAAPQFCGVSGGFPMPSWYHFQWNMKAMDYRGRPKQVWRFCDWAHAPVPGQLQLGLCRASWAVILMRR